MWLGFGPVSFGVVSTVPGPPDPDKPVETPFADAASPFKRTRIRTAVPFFPGPAPQPPGAPALSTWVIYRAQINFGLALVAYLMVLVGAVTVIRANPHAGWLYVVAALPLAPAAMAVVVFMRALTRLDGVQVRIQVQAFGLAVGATALITFGYGFLEGAGLPDLPIAIVLPLMAIFWLLGAALFTWRSR